MLSARGEDRSSTFGACQPGAACASTTVPVQPSLSADTAAACEALTKFFAADTAQTRLYTSPVPFGQAVPLVRVEEQALNAVTAAGQLFLSHQFLVDVLGVLVLEPRVVRHPHHPVSACHIPRPGFGPTTNSMILVSVVHA